MGEIAEMMINGDLCENCGEFIDDEGGDGFPRYCSSRCASDRGADEDDDAYEDFLDFQKKCKVAKLFIKQALKQYKALTTKIKCGKKCKKNKGRVNHAIDCEAKFHKDLAKKSWSEFKEIFI